MFAFLIEFHFLVFVELNPPSIEQRTFLPAAAIVIPALGVATLGVAVLGGAALGAGGVYLFTHKRHGHSNESAEPIEEMDQRVRRAVARYANPEPADLLPPIIDFPEVEDSDRILTDWLKIFGPNLGNAYLYPEEIPVKEQIGLAPTYED